MKLFADADLKYGDLILRKLKLEMRDEMAALASDQDIWTHYHRPFPTPELFKEKWFDKGLQDMANKKRMVYAVYWQGKLAGSSSYYEIYESHKRLHIGYTWYHPDFWGTKLNPTAKYLLLKHAFEDLGYFRVEFFIDSENQRSCKAVEKLGACKEGMLKKHMLRHDQSHRDTVVYAITDDMWSKVSQNLLAKINGA